MTSSSINTANDLLVAGILLADDFPTYYVSFKQIVADFFSEYYYLESTGTKT